MAQDLEPDMTPVSWNAIFPIWRAEMKNAKVDIDRLFEELPLCDPYEARRSDDRFSSWAVQGDEFETQLFAQMWLCGLPSGDDASLVDWSREAPGRKSSGMAEDRFLFPFDLDQPMSIAGTRYTAELETLDMAWRHRKDPKMLGAILTAAQLRSRWDKEKASTLFDAVIEKAAKDFMSAGGLPPIWRYRSPSSLPEPSRASDSDRSKCRSLQDSVAMIAGTQAGLLKERSLLIFRFVDRIPQNLVAESERRAQRFRQMRDGRIQEKITNEAAEQARIEEDRRQHEEYVAKKRAAHPRFGDWRDLPDDELRRLVWEKPTSTLAAEFGISDVAIKKRCQTRKIEKPPRGFWAKVHAGKPVSRPQRPAGRETDR